ncbi:MAG TPA: N-methyl-L-tryptophan oxidase [Gemmatimonadales bacterium]|nr:N-methyl-L-tryptophan oxidase [Gemmatimonadales bacterium]
MRRDYDYIALGLGGLGSAAAYWLARTAGRDVLGLEQFELGHLRGESQDHSRIIRLSYHTPAYVQLARRAYDCWATLEADARTPCVLRTGGLDLAPEPTRIPLDPYAASMEAEGVPFEHLTAEEIMHRWPPFRLTDDCHGLFQPDAGIAMAAVGTFQHQRMAREYGATLLAETPVSAVRSVAGEVEVIANGAAYRCSRLVIAAGPWSATVLGMLGLQLPLEVTQEQVTYYRTPKLHDFEPDRFPVWIWMDDPCFYGFPVFGEPATKIAQDAGGRVVTADTRTFDPDPENSARVEAWARRFLPTALGPVHLVKTCLYTLTPDRDFVIDRVPGQPQIAVAIGAGHAFKFASVIGRILSELSIVGTTPSDLTPFAIERPILLETNPTRSYMV